MNIKNIFLTTGISIFFGMYSIYNIVHYIQRIEMKHHSQVEQLNKIIDDSYKHYENIKNEYLKMRDEIVYLTNKIKVLENEIKEKENNMVNESEYVSSSDYETNSERIICDTLCAFNPDAPVIPTQESSNSLNTIFSQLSDETIENTINSDSKIDYLFNSAETVNKINKIFNSDDNLEIITPPPSKSSSFCDTESVGTGITRTRSRSISVNEVNWIDITKRFIFG